MDDRAALGRTPVGRRFIALMTIFNQQQPNRLRQYIDESYSAALLEAAPTEHHLSSYGAIFQQRGKVRVEQVLASEEHRVVVLMQGQADSAYYVYEMAVESDYPHKITTLSHQPVNK
ncbi:MAG: hypothetical protein K8I30_09860 [Anaerolineae bacterium]|nr:hypothetical protein [Anaerolineae bacterium]